MAKDKGTIEAIEKGGHDYQVTFDFDGIVSLAPCGWACSRLSPCSGWLLWSQTELCRGSSLSVVEPQEQDRVIHLGGHPRAHHCLRKTCTGIDWNEDAQGPIVGTLRGACFALRRR
jgi:hypothetical protein